MLLSELAPLIDAQQGVMYVVDGDEPGEAPRLHQLAGYADDGDPSAASTASSSAKGLVGQCARSRRQRSS